MRIYENTNYLTQEKSYNIRIEQTDDLEAQEIALCFKEQYPDKMASVSFAKITQVEYGVYLVGLNIKSQEIKND